MKSKALTMEDRVLWTKVARSTVPLAGKSAGEPLLESESFADLLDAPPLKRASGAASPPQPASPARPRQLRQQRIDAPTRDKIARAKLPLEGKVDLHGLTQIEAHALLLSFLRRAHAGGRRHVLVVTGKGSSSGGDGVLRRAVPGWFATAPFRPLVSGHEQAARRHGGEGALYVRLRRPAVGAP